MVDGQIIQYSAKIAIVSKEHISIRDFKKKINDWVNREYPHTLKGHIDIRYLRDGDGGIICRITSGKNCVDVLRLVVSLPLKEDESYDKYSIDVMELLKFIRREYGGEMEVRFTRMVGFCNNGIERYTFTID
jgi:hypothetical protein